MAVFADNWLTAAFNGTLILGRPTNTSITASLLSNDTTETYLEYSTQSEVYTDQTDVNTIQAGTPFNITIQNLQPDTRYYYRLCFRQPGEIGFRPGPEHTFHTQRSAGSAFTFTVQADPHLGDENTNNQLYEIALQNALADAPDFHIDLGDTFMTEKLYPRTNEGVLEAAFNHRPYFDIIARSTCLFLVNGNHEAELGWELDGTANNIAIWSTHARQYYYPTPAPGSFYSGSATTEPYIGIRDGYYGWTWGDALFIVLDPFWYTTIKPNKSGNGWDWTLGYEQYSWLKNTLEQSDAEFKFVFTHHLFGSLNGRGGIETAVYYEWGGLNADDTWGFDTQRPGWAMPIHDLLTQNDVSVVFHGHDHLFIKQDLDGVVYQLVPRPNIRDYDNIKNAQNYGYVNGDALPNSGHLRVSVSEQEATVDYVRAYLPQDTNDVRINGQVAYTYNIMK